jgi:hypothetical protein
VDFSEFGASSFPNITRQWVEAPKHLFKKFIESYRSEYTQLHPGVLKFEKEDEVLCFLEEIQDYINKYEEYEEDKETEASLNYFEEEI